MMVVSIYLGESNNPLIQLLNHCFDTNQPNANVEYLRDNYGIELETEMKEMCTWEEYKVSVAKEEQTILILKNLMKKLNIGLKEAMNMVDISESEQNKYTELMTEENRVIVE